MPWLGALDELTEPSRSTIRAVLQDTGYRAHVVVHPFYEGLFAEEDAAFPRWLSESPRRGGRWNPRNWRRSSVREAWSAIHSRFPSRMVEPSSLAAKKRMLRWIKGLEGLVIVFEERTAFIDWEDGLVGVKFMSEDLHRATPDVGQFYCGLNSGASWVAVPTFDGAGIPWRDPNFRTVPTQIARLGVRSVLVSGGLFQPYPTCGTTVFLALHASRRFAAVDLGEAVRVS